MLPPTERLALAARKAGVGRFVHISSIAAREPGLSDYGASKRQSEVMVRQRAGDMSWVILRPPAVYGPGDRGTLPLIKQISQKTANIPGNPGSRFSLIHVEDLARAILVAATMGTRAGEIYELHDGHQDGYSWVELAAIAGRVEGQAAECRFVPRALADVAGLAGLAFGNGDRQSADDDTGKRSGSFITWTGSPDTICLISRLNGFPK